ncbi:MULTISPECIES: hypothetical protein [Halobellus]|uniref:hypothetical protein n=1 Tax=Halobellus TaxID=1073986 RepID=UPI00210C1EE9|nr:MULTISPECIES: hypothetical protein [Halobellus]MDQ2053027.1 hypothetical protein [Halobellus sp. H-GB7]
MTRIAAHALLVVAGTAAVPIVFGGVLFPEWTFATVGFLGYLAAVALVVVTGMSLAVVDLTSAVERLLGP